MESTNRTVPWASATIVIVGITGDLADKKLLPALYELAKRGLLSDTFRLVGTSRHDITNEQILEKLGKATDDPTLNWLSQRLTTVALDPSTPDGARLLAQTLGEARGPHLFYLSIPPSSFEAVITGLAAAGLNTPHDRLLIEKPFGRDVSSALELQRLIRAYYDEANVYRVDHYLAKPGVLAFHDAATSPYDPAEIERIDIRSDESLDIQGRGDFYEQTGALRDVVQSHLLQVLGTVIAAGEDPATRAQKKTEALQSLGIVEAFRAQYDGYRQEVGHAGSVVETYAELRLASSLAGWENIRMRVRSGKALPEKISSIELGYHDGTTKTFDMNANPSGVLEGYERVLYDAATGEHRLFLRDDDVEASWRIVDGLLGTWSASADGLAFYAKQTYPQVNSAE